MSILSYVFMQHAFLAATIASVVCGIVGTYITVRQMTAASGGISHATFGGVGLGYLLGFSPIIGATWFAICAAVIIGILKEYAHQKIEILISVVWSIGMALGILFVALTPGYVPDIESYLFGNILLVTSRDLALAGILAVIIIVVVLLLYQPLLAITFDEEYAKVMNLPVKMLNFLLLILIALSVVMLIQMVGIILVISLLTLPAASCRMLTSRLWVMMVSSVVVTEGVSCSGILLSYFWNIPSGATITLAAVCVFLVVVGTKWCIKERRQLRHTSRTKTLM